MIRTFRQLTRRELSLAGGKGGTLARLSRAGYPVPEGFVLLPGAFHGEALDPRAWESAASLLERMRRGNPQASFAVRSSALGEDSVHASFAGGYRTLLDLRSDDEVRLAVLAVRSSRSAERVQAYARARGLAEAGEVAVVIQRFVHPDLSGVLFTADPLTGDRRRMVGNLARGAGEDLVSGRVSGERFTFESPGGGYIGPDAFQPHARRLFRMARRLERDLGCPQDIEWALSGGRLYLLQSRPITTLQSYDPALGQWNDSRTGDYLWSNANFGEAMPGVMTPAAWSAVQFTLGDWVYVPGVPLTGNLGGRLYINISALASLFAALGRSRADLLSALEATMYMRLPAGLDLPTFTLPPCLFLLSLFHSARIRLKQEQGTHRLRRYLEGNLAWFERTSICIREARTGDELVDTWTGGMAEHIRQGRWCVLGSVDRSTDYTLRLRRDLVRLAGPEDADLLIADLGAGSGRLASLTPLLGIEQVARGQMPREAYLQAYGHRGPDEFELSVPRPAEDPGWLDREVARFLASPVDIHGMLERQHSASAAAWERLRQYHPRQANALRRRLTKNAVRARLREEARSAYTRDRWAIRRFALRAGELTGLGNDIFFLTLPEMLELLRGDDRPKKVIPARQRAYQEACSLPPYPTLIRGRFDPVRWAADPRRRTDHYDASGTAPAPAAEGAITGSPGCAGQVEGRVRVLSSPEEGHLLQPGEVLVAVQTDIAWTPLFPRLAAVVTDIGAPLSHAAIVARELGVPAVVGCGDATMRLRTGDRVRVDGSRGVVEILEQSAPQHTL